MQIINNACKNISDYISAELNLSQEKKAVINYGIFALIQMALSIILVIVFGIVFDALFESLIISFSVSILRKSSGGAHADSPEKCAIIGTIMSIILGVLAKKTSIDLFYINVLGVLVFLWAYYWVYKLAPVDSKNKPIKTLKKKTRLKKSSLTILSIYLLIALLFSILSSIFDERSFAIYIICIYYGVIWQVFSLTKIGHIILGIFNERG